MPNNYVLLEKIVVGAAGASSITFSNIPQTGYTDLVLVTSLRSNTGDIASNTWLTFNGVGGTSYSSKILYTSNGTTTTYGGESSAARTTQLFSNSSTSTSSTFGNMEIYIPNYTSSNFKSWSANYVTENNATSAHVGIVAGLFSSTAAITSITLQPYTADWGQYSTAYLYGVAKLGTTPSILPYATGGDTIMTDGDYWYHAFRSSGTFAPITNLSCDVLVVAGGGGAAGSTQYFSGGGGGAGGVLAHSAQSLVATNYTVTVGAGGTGSSSTDVDAHSSGNNSQFGSLTASVYGGRGGSLNGRGGTFTPGSSGGVLGTSQGPNDATVGQGFKGGTNSIASQTGSGGGGAGGPGFPDAASPNGTAGGPGVNAYTNWGSLTAALTATGTGVSGFIAGGGGGGGSPAYGTVTQSLGGSGGGGNGGTLSSTGVTSGVANTGSGGGGAAGTHPSAAPPFGVGGAGGSGLVIVRYPV